MQMLDFCETCFQAYGIPLTCYQGETLIYSTIFRALQISPVPIAAFASSVRNPDFHTSASGMLYGRIRLSDGWYYLDVGPVSEVPVNDASLRAFMREHVLPAKLRDSAADFLTNIPRLTSSQFLYYLTFLHYVLNQERISVSEHFFQNNMDLARPFSTAGVLNAYHNKENLNFHNTYFYEQELYNLIQKGSLDELKKFMITSSNPLREGILADTPLRQAKNIFIGAATKAGILGAIPGGLDIEQTYELIDLYIQEAERKSFIEDIQQLQYTMLLDFCSRVNGTRIPEGISAELFLAMDFIRTHTNEPIRISDVADFLNRSNSYTIQLFKKNLGINIGAYITRCKLEEAKSLLAYSTKSLLEISTFLCFSSQAYFQNVFKKKYGITPLQYRRQHQTTARS